MGRMGNFKRLFASLSLALFVLAPACAKSTDQPTYNRGDRGESCQARNDCNSGLACVGGTCTTGSIAINTTGKECVAIECQTAQDCCGYSGCNPAPWLCTANMCESNNVCTMDTDCYSSSTGQYCVGGKCATCKVDTDCPNENSCIAGKCQAKCTSDGECTGLAHCNAGACVEDGCRNDRECVMYTKNARSTCSATKCGTPCSSDLECSGNQSLQKCQSGSCVFVGCDTDKDCYLYGGYSGGNQGWSCKPIGS